MINPPLEMSGGCEVCLAIVQSAVAFYDTVPDGEESSGSHKSS
jgi:hypothetical protein